MKTTLNADGKIGIPDEIRQTDHLTAGDSFELERLTPGHYLLTKQPPRRALHCGHWGRWVARHPPGERRHHVAVGEGH